MQEGDYGGTVRMEGGHDIMKKNEYLMMLCQDNETETEPLKELHEAVFECTVEALSQMGEDFEVDSKIGLPELYKVIEAAGKGTKAQCVSPFRAAELIAEKLGANYKRPLDRVKALIGGSRSKPSAGIDLEDFI